MKTPGLCPDCHGKGWLELRCAKADEPEICTLCNGAGASPTGKPCSGCAGTGRIKVRTVEREKCLPCRGTGRFPLQDEL